MVIKRIIEIDLYRYIKGLLNGKKVIFLWTLIIGLIGAMAAFFLIEENNEYDATATVYSIAYGSYSESEQAGYAVRKYSDIIKSYKVAERATLLLADKSVSKEDIYNMIYVEPLVIEGTTYLYETTSSVIRIHAVSQKQNMAMQVVNAVADAFVMEVNSLSDVEATQVLDYAYDTEISFNADQTKLVVFIAGIVVGFLLGCLIILYRIIFTDKIVSVNEASIHGELEIVGVIPRF